MDTNLLKCEITVLTGFKLGIHHLIAGGIREIENSQEFKEKTESRIAKIHLELDHYIWVLKSELERLEDLQKK